MKLEIRGAYPPDWRVIADRVKAEAGQRCIRCGHPHDPGAGRMLTVHHLDGDKSNGRWWNLLALCQACHLSVQARVIPERSWLFEHSAWFRVYVAGFYAHYYGGRAITRAEAEADLDHWLRLNPAYPPATSP